MTLPIPEAFASSNVMIEATLRSTGLRRAQPVYNNNLKVHVVENFGQLKVAHGGTGRPLPRVYVKVYAQLPGGRSKFYKDGYTDLRGRFDYTSLNNDLLDRVQEFAILVSSDEHGAVVRKAPPPKQ